MKRYADRNDTGIERKVAIGTGAASGIGRVAARMFARERAKVAVSTARNLQGGRETVHLIREAGGEATFMTCDISQEERVEAMVAQTVDLYGSLHFGLLVFPSVGPSKTSAGRASRRWQMEAGLSDR